MLSHRDLASRTDVFGESVLGHGAAAVRVRLKDGSLLVEPVRYAVDGRFQQRVFQFFGERHGFVQVQSILILHLLHGVALRLGPVEEVDEITTLLDLSRQGVIVVALLEVFALERLLGHRFLKLANS